MGIPTSILVLFALLFLAELELCSTRSNLSCIESEREALVKFKESLTETSNRLSSWVGEDCCTWNGVGCSNKTGHDLKLDLRIRIPEFLGSLRSLRYLNLSAAGFGGRVLHHLGNLSSLMYLDLGSRPFDNVYINTFTVDSLRWASALSSLKYLNLDNVKLPEATDWLDAINMLPSLSELSLAECELGSIPPLSHVNFTSLTSLDLQRNIIDSIPLWLSNVSRLVNLRVNQNVFQGSVPDTIGKLTSLTILGLSWNNFNTSMPIWLCGLSNLVSLDLSSNSFKVQFLIALRI
ncbi:hypothetical protein F0562_032511 [Nyssa sinensis]|uniref:Leucine-rich repeat-containing N-terminal plant-type domain-containing protein n=1 Tax=Nyssa sinensis TaxID=561372 RepID=A0A5J5AQE9_9ASTE|nr:hypothetical protein F0562_032511 [Nyssa sinensis]